MFWPPENVTFFHSKLLYNCKFSQHQGWTFGHYHFTDLAYADDDSYVWTAPSRQCPPINAFAGILDFKLSWPKTKLQNVGACDPPSTILIDGVPVEGVEEFVYFGSKQSSNGYCRLDVLRRIVLFSDEYRGYGIAVISCSISTKVHL